MYWPGLKVKNPIGLGSTFLVLVGLVALLAWLFQARTILQILPGRSVMVCDTAGCFVLIGLTFQLLLRNARRLPRILSFLLLMLGTAYLLASLTGTWLSVHALFPEFTAKVIAPISIYNCHPSTASAASILVTGAFLSLMTYSRLGRVSSFLAAFLATVLPVFGILGVVFSFAGSPTQDTWIGYLARMPLLTSACIFASGLCACQLLWIRTEQREYRHFPTAATLLLLGLFVLIASVNSLILNYGHTALRTTAGLQTMDREIDLIQRSVQSVRKAETGQRGFLLTQSEQNLRTYEAGLSEARAQLAALPASSAFNPVQFRNLCNQKLAELASSIELQRRNQRPAALAIVNSGAGLAMMDQIDAEAGRLLLALQTQSSRRLAENNTPLQLVQRTVLLSSLVAAVAILVGILIIWIEVIARARVEKQLRESSRGLQTKVDERTREVRQYTGELEKEAARREVAATQLRLSLDLAKVALWTSFPQTRTIVWAGPVQEIFGVPASQLNTFEAFSELIHPADRGHVYSVADGSEGKNAPFQKEFRIILPSGELRWIAGIGDTVLDKAGRVIQIAGINMDITARKQMEERLAASELHFRGLAESVPQIVWAADARGEIDYQNEQWSRITGLPPGRLTPEVRASIIHPGDREAFAELRSQATREGRAHDVEFRLFDVRHQEYRWHWLHVVPVRDDKGSIVRWFGTSTDVHQRTTAKLRLAESEQRLRDREQQLALVFESGSVGDYVWDLERGEIDAHPAVWALFGEAGRRGSASADWFIQRIHPEDWDSLFSAIQTATNSANSFDVEARVLLADGSVRWLGSRGFSRQDHAGVPTVIHGLVFDTTGAKLAALRLRESERHFREMANAMPQIVWRTLPNGVVDYCNARFYEYTGFSAGQTISWAGVVHPEDLRKWVEATAHGFTSRQPSAVEFRLLRAADQTYRWHLARLVPYLDLQGDLRHWFGAAADIHEQKLYEARLEAEVRQRTAALQQLEVKEGQLTRSLLEKDTLFHEMHHRVKNNLTVISSLLRMQAESVKDPAAAGALKESHQRVLSMALIHEQLYTNHKLAQIDFEEFTRKLVSELVPSYIGGTERVTCLLNTMPVFLKIDQAIPLGLILNELTTNALKYAYPKDASGDILVDLSCSKDGRVKLSIADHGVGLPDNFDWTNSASMGLPIVDMLTQQLGGTLTVNGRPGAAFIVDFPVSAEPEKADAVSAA